MRLILFILFCLPSFVSSAQDLTGVWRGHFKSNNYSRLLDSLGIEDRYKFETQIEQSNKSIEGVTYSYKTTVFYGKAACYGAFNPKTKKVLLEENKLIEVKSESGGACLMTCFLQYSKVGSEEFLEGTFTAMNVTDSTPCPGGTVFLRKVPNSDFYKEPFLVEKEKNQPSSPPTKITPEQPESKPPVAKRTSPQKATQGTKSSSASAPKKQVTASAKPPIRKPSTTKPKNVSPPPPALKKSEALKQLPADTTVQNIPMPDIKIPVPRVLETRQNELVKTITTVAKDVFIKIYDNGTIDNDTVSVYVDKKLVISKQRLTENAITLKVTLDQPGEIHELVMVAENLGEIPPNTSLMIVSAGTETYEVRITSTEQKNAVIRFRKG
jgi:hypothetical protein